MEELRPQDIEDLLQELEEEGGAEESPPPDVGELLHVLQSGSAALDRRDAAEQLGNVEPSSPQIIRALIAAYESDPSTMVNTAAARSLGAPVHQEYLQQHPDLMEATERALEQSPGADRSPAAVVRTVSPTETHAKMLKEVRSWGLWLVGLGVVSLILSGLGGSWGIVLLVAGLASFVFREASMFVVYSIILAWAGISNILSGQISWIVFAAFQLVLAFWVFRKYTGFRRAEAALDSLPGPQRASRAFPQIGCALGALALLGLVFIFFAGVIFLGATGSANMPGLLVWLESLVLGLAVLGLAVATASLLSGYRHKLMAILGIVASSLVLLAQIAFALAQWVGTSGQTKAPTAVLPSAGPTVVPPIPEGMRQLDPGWTSYMTEGELRENIEPGAVVVGGFWADIAVASDGALWFITLGGGVLHFDGETWTPYTQEEGLASNTGLSSTAGRGPLGGTGDMQWFATAKGICRFDGETWTSYPESAHLAGGPGPTALGPDGALWYGTAKGATRFDGEDWITYTTADGLAANYVLDIVVGPEGAMWFATNGGVSRFDGDSWTSFTTADGLARNRVASAALAPDGALCFGTEGGVSRFDGETWIAYNKDNSGLLGNEIEALAFDPQGRAWIATRKGDGVNVFDGETWIACKKSNSGLVSNKVEAIAFDQKGQAWLATRKEGISVLSTYGALTMPVWLVVLRTLFFSPLARGCLIAAGAGLWLFVLIRSRTRRI